MKRIIETTKDGSKTLFIKELNEGYHSHHGALQEAKHVFIKNGFNRLNNYEINILELGFGTGLNVLVAIDEYLKSNDKKVVHYISLEKYPINETEIEGLEYSSLFNDIKLTEVYHKIHHAEWDEKTEIIPNFFLTKIECDFYELDNLELPKIDLVYFDCFGARVQPDLWEMPLFEMVVNTMNENSLLTTYSAKGSVRRILQDLGLTVEKLAGPPGKREMINAWKG